MSRLRVTPHLQSIEDRSDRKGLQVAPVDGTKGRPRQMEIQRLEPAAASEREIPFDGGDSVVMESQTRQPQRTGRGMKIAGGGYG